MTDKFKEPFLKFVNIRHDLKKITEKYIVRVLSIFAWLLFLKRKIGESEQWARVLRSGFR